MAEQHPVPAEDRFRRDLGGAMLTPRFLAKLPYTRAITLSEVADFKTTILSSDSSPTETVKDEVVIITEYTNPEDGIRNREILDAMIEEEMKELGGNNGS